VGMAPDVAVGMAPDELIPYDGIRLDRCMEVNYRPEFPSDIGCGGWVPCPRLCVGM